MTALAITSITNFLLAGEVLFLAGMSVRAPKARFSAAWFFAGVLLLLGLSALAGGIDHGFIEPARLPRYFIQRLTWILLASMTFCLFMTTARQFFPARVQRILIYAALIQFAGGSLAALLVDSFLVVVVNYAPVLIIFLGMNFLGLRRGDGSVDMIVGLLSLAGASCIQALNVDVFSPLDHNGLYHVISMVGVVFLYWGGRRLSPAPRHLI